jgi:nucleoside phosphorylase
VLITGLCGGLDPNLSSGQVIQFSQIVDDPTGKTFDAAGADHIRHRLVSSKRIITTRQAKAELHQRRQAAAVDMESASIAAICEKLNLRWSCIRAVCDPADEALPAQLSQIVRPNGTTSVAAGLRTALLGPHRLPAMLRLSRRSRSATRSLANAVENWHRKEARAINNATPTPVTADVDD